MLIEAEQEVSVVVTDEVIIPPGLVEALIRLNITLTNIASSFTRTSLTF